ncbi:MFS transporter [Nonomuraea sp. NPDC002799]
MGLLRANPRNGERRLGRRFTLLLSASWISTLGDGARTTALPLLAAAVSSSPADVAWVAAARAVPWLAFSPFSGVLADRLNPIRLMFWTDAARATIMGSIAIWAVIARPPILALVVTAFFLGIGETISRNSGAKVVPDLVGPHQLEIANSRVQTSYVLGAGVVGPMLGSLLFTVAIGLPFILDSLSFIFSALLVGAIGRTSAAGAAERKPVFSEVGDGIRWLWTHRGFRALAAVAGLVSMASALSTTTLVILVTKDLHASASTFGLVMVVGSGGGLLGTMISRWVGRRGGVTFSIMLAVATMGIAAVVMGLSASVWLVAAMLAMVLFGVGIWNVQIVSLRQKLIPRELFGRVNSSYLLVSRIGMLAGPVISGWVSVAIDMRAPIVLGGITMLLTLILVPRIVSQE